MKKVLTVTVAMASMAFLGTAASASVLNEYHWAGNIAIPDGSGSDVPGAAVFAEINIIETGIITDLTVGISVTHTWQGDLRIWLRHVDSGQEIYLLNRAGRFPPTSTFGYSSDNFGNLATGDQMLFNDAGAGTYNRAERGGIQGGSGVDNVTGIWQADDITYDGFGGNNSLSMFNGKDKHGVWQLWAADFAGGDTGALREFSLYFEKAVPAPGALALLGLAGLVGLRRRRN